MGDGLVKEKGPLPKQDPYLKWLEPPKNKRGRANFRKGVVRFFPP